MKRFNIMHNVGRCKYLVNFHDGIKTHTDGSPFFDLATFKNKINLKKFVIGLVKSGYVESISYITNRQEATQ